MMLKSWRRLTDFISVQHLFYLNFQLAPKNNEG